MPILQARVYVAYHPEFYAWQLSKEMAPMSYPSGKLNPPLALIPHKIQEIEFRDCLASDLGWGTWGGEGAEGDGGGPEGGDRGRRQDRHLRHLPPALESAEIV